MRMSPTITDEQRQALQQNPGQPVRVRDEKTDQVYLLFGAEGMSILWEEYIRREVEQGLAEIDRGEVEDWEVESVKAEGRRILDTQDPLPS
jgi:hypothetical protein